MTQFLAILKDSFREAMDGFVIYAMLVLSALTILIVGSMSFTPAEPQEAFEQIASRFNVIIPDRGRSQVVSGDMSSTYKVTGATPVGAGYKLRLTVNAHRSEAMNEKGEKDEKGEKAEPKAVGDSFRAAVLQWNEKAGKTISVDIPEKGQKGKARKFEVASPKPTTPEEQLAVTTAQMEEFLTSQFDLHAGMTANVKRVTEGVAEPTYVFDVTTASGAGIRGWPHTTKIFFGSVTVSKQATLGQTLYILEDKLMNGFGAGVALLIAIIITAFFVPNMIRKGSIDLLISKPIGRTPLLIYKYIGGLTFIFLLSTFSIGGVWLVIALRSGFWDPTFLILIPILTFSFAILYSVSVLFGVLTRNPIVSMLGTIAFMFVLWIAGWAKNIMELVRSERSDDDLPKWLVWLIDGVTTVLPRYKDLDTITSKLIIDGTLTRAEAPFSSPVALLDYPSWSVTIGTSLAFIVVMLALACWRFKRRDS